MKRIYFAFILLLFNTNSNVFVPNAQQFSKVTVKIIQGNSSASLLSTVNTNTHTNLTGITIEEEDIPILKTDTFEGLLNLYEIVIRRTNLRHLERNVFRNLPKLRQINLNFNRIETLSNHDFNNVRLISIALRGNGIKSLSSKTFNNLPDLRFLDLGMNNIEDIPKNIFRRTGNLKVLDLSYNKLRHYPAIPYRPYSYFEQAFANAVKHESTILDLSFNNFTFISYYLLRGIRFIEELRLNDNNIDLISEYAFDDLKWAKNLNLENNNLKELSDGLLVMLQTSEELQLENNPWEREFICKYEKWSEFYKKRNSMDITCQPESVTIS